MAQIIDFYTGSVIAQNQQAADSYVTASSIELMRSNMEQRVEQYCSDLMHIAHKLADEITLEERQ